MPEFVPATDIDIKSLRALGAAQRQLRRNELRIAIKDSRVRLARALKAARGTRRVTDLRWHAHITLREAHALGALAGAVKARGVIRKALARVRERLLHGRGT